MSLLDTQPASGYLLLEDGTRFAGTLAGAMRGGAGAAGKGATRAAVGEVVFTTNMTGYQEVLTDPSYAGQIVVMTAPMMGNYGTRAGDEQSDRPRVAGFVLRHLSAAAGGSRSDGSLAAYLEEREIPTLVGVDTRALTRRIREEGAMGGVLAAADLAEDAARERLAAEPSMEGRDLASAVAATEPYGVEAVEPERGRVVCLDYGVKRKSLELLRREGYAVRVVPGGTDPEDVLADEPAGIFVSNGPGDPEAVAGAARRLRALAESGTPVFGICLGHQLLARAFGGENFKLRYGHRGGNHPVRNLDTGDVEITSQNHGFAVRAEGEAVAGDTPLRVTHRNLNDGTIEGVAHGSLPVFGVQYHPESAPGPHDSRYLFDAFVAAMKSG